MKPFDFPGEVGEHGNIDTRDVELKADPLDHRLRLTDRNDDSVHPLQGGEQLRLVLKVRVEECGQVLPGGLLSALDAVVADK